MYLFTDEAAILATRTRLESNSFLKTILKERADKLLEAKPLSVTFSKSFSESGNPHDYFSEAPYWWQDESNPGGAYIRRDGEENPNVFKSHRRDLTALCDTVIELSQAGLYLCEKKYYAKAIELIRIWFLDEKTKMSPHLEYAQAIRGVTSGRGIGIIDTCTLIKLVVGASIIEMSGDFKKEISALKGWLSDYVTWLCTSKNGLSEKNYFNNHGNWWNTQVAVYSAFIGNESLLTECFESFKNDKIVNQTDENGFFADELTRTRSYFYTVFNMTACAIICELAFYKGVDLWNYSSANGHSIKKSVYCFLPYYENPFLWKHMQFNSIGCFDEKLPMVLSAKRFSDSRIDAANRQRSENTLPLSNLTHLGYIDFI